MRLHRPAKYKSTKVQNTDTKTQQYDNSKLQNSNRSAKPSWKNEIAQARVFLVGQPRLEWSLVVGQNGRGGRESGKEKEEKVALTTVAASCVETSELEAFGKCKMVKLFTVG